MYVAAGVGYIGGVLAAFLLGRRLLAAMARRRKSVSQGRLVVRFGAGAGLVALVPALLLGTVIGGTFGGSLGDRLAPSGAGVAAGLAIGQFAIVCVILVASVGLGGLLGGAVANRAESG